MIENAKTIEVLEGDVVVNTIIASEEVAEQMFPGSWRTVVVEDVPDAPPARHVTVLAFRNRFTKTEKVRIELLSMNDPAANVQQRERAATIRVGQADLAVATYVDLDLADTRIDVLAFEAMDLLDARGRALEILDGPIAESEKYYG